MKITSKARVFALVLGVTTSSLWAQADHLLISEVGVDTYLQEEGASSNYVEIYNPTTATVLLENYYLADTNLYTSITLTATLDTGATDNIIRFPAGTSLAPGQHAIVTGSGMNFIEEFFEGDSSAFAAIPGAPTLFETTETSGSIANLISLNTGGANEAQRTNFDLKDGREFLILFYWNGLDPTVKDVDLVVWGGGPQDGDSFVPKKPSTPAGPGGAYVTDAGLNGTVPISAGFTMGERLDPVERSEVQTGGNGLTGHDETTEYLPGSWRPLDYYQANPGVSSLYTNAGSKPPLISVGLNTSYPTSATAITINVFATDHDGTVASVTAYVDSGSGFTPVSAVPTSQTNFNVALGTYPDGTIIRYYIEATDNTGTVGRFPLYGALDPKIVFVSDTHVIGPDLVINEVLYDTVGPDDPYEFVEIYNRKATTLKLPYFTFSGQDLTPLEFPQDIEISGNGFLVLTRNREDLLGRYAIPNDVPVLQWKYGSLSNLTDAISLADYADILMANLTYFKGSSWPVPNVSTADQTIELKHPNLNYRSGSNWATSVNQGTPGLPNSVLNTSVDHWMLY